MCARSEQRKQLKFTWNLPGYEIVRNDRNRHGGGVALYTRSNISYTRRTDLETDDIECIWVEIKNKQRKPLLVCSVYRPPSTQAVFIDNLNNMLDEMLISGDFNIDVLNVNTSLNFIDLF